MFLCALALAIALTLPSPALAKADCRTAKCEQRVAKRHAVKAHFHYCNTWRCVVKARGRERRRLERDARRLSPLARCIIHHESGGNPLAKNGKYKGIAQWSPYVWARDGGHRFGPTPHHATYAEQVSILKVGLARHGCADWCPFDPC